MKVAPKPMHLGERSYSLRDLGFTEHIQCLLGKFKENKITEQMQKRHKISICGLAGTEQKSKKGNLPQIICRYTNPKKSFFLKIHHKILHRKFMQSILRTCCCSTDFPSESLTSNTKTMSSL